MDTGMFFLLLSFFCGIAFAQEFPGLPKLRPKIEQLVDSLRSQEN